MASTKYALLLLLACAAPFTPGCGSSPSSSSDGNGSPGPATGADGGSSSTTPSSCGIGKAVVVASGQQGASEIVADDQFVYWITRTDAKLWRAPVDGADVTPELVADGASGYALAQDATHVFAVVSFSLTAIDKSTLEKKSIGGASSLRGLVARGGSVFFESSGIYEWNGTKSTKLRPSSGGASGFRNLTADDAFVYDLTASPAKIPVAGGDPVPLAGVDPGFAVASDAAHLYVARQSGLDVVTKDGTAVGSAPVAAIDVAADADGYYVLTSSGPMRGAPGSTTLAPLSEGGVVAVTDVTTSVVNGIAVNAKSVFFTASKASPASNEVYRVEKCASGS